MRNQRQSFRRFTPALHLLAFTALMAVSSPLLAEDPVPLPPEGVHFQFVVPVNLTNLGPSIKSVSVTCTVNNESSGDISGVALGSGTANIPVDATGKANRTVTIRIVQISGAPSVTLAKRWFCRIFAVGDTGTAQFRITAGPGVLAALRTGSPVPAANNPGKSVEASGAIK